MLHKLGYKKSINQNEHLYILLTFLTSHFPSSNLRGPCAPRASVYEVPPRFALANAPQQPAVSLYSATRWYNGNLRGPPRAGQYGLIWTSPKFTHLLVTLTFSAHSWSCPAFDFYKANSVWKEESYKFHTNGFLQSKALSWSPCSTLRTS